MATVKKVLTFQQKYQATQVLEKFIKDGVTTLRREDLAKEVSRQTGLDVSVHSLDALVKAMGATYCNARRRGDQDRRPTSILARCIKQLFEKLGEPVPDELFDVLERKPGAPTWTTPQRNGDGAH